MCPTCCLFGFISSEEGKRYKDTEEDDKALASRIRFSDALFIHAKNQPTYLEEGILNELASPKLSASEFYLSRPRNNGSMAHIWNYDYAGNPISDEYQVNIYTTMDQLGSEVSMSTAGNYFIVWQSDGQYCFEKPCESCLYCSSWDVYGRLLEGPPPPPPTPTPTMTPPPPTPTFTETPEPTPTRTKKPKNN